MGAFVLGILVGWLAEWLFYTFWLKGGKNSDCSSIMAELEERKKEINRLQSRLNEATSSAAASNTTTSTTSSKAESTTTAASTSKTANKPASTKEAPKKAAESKATAKKAAPKKTTAKAAPKKAAAKKVAPKKAATKSTAKAKSAAKTKKVGDDFTKLSGIGPSIEATLKGLGIDTFTKLADTDDDILRDMLEASGARLNNNKEAMDSWNEQATLAAKGDFEGLKKLQEALKK